MKCPKCNGTEISAQKTGFGLGKAITGAILTGGVGLLAGFVGSNKVNIHCLSCGHKWNPAKQAKIENKEREVEKQDRDAIKEKRRTARIKAWEIKYKTEKHGK